MIGIYLVQKSHYSACDQTHTGVDAKQFSQEGVLKFYQFILRTVELYTKAPRESKRVLLYYTLQALQLVLVLYGIFYFNVV